MCGCKCRAVIRHVDVRDLILGFNSPIIIWFQLRRPCRDVCSPPPKVRDLIPGFKWMQVHLIHHRLVSAKRACGRRTASLDLDAVVLL
jgi:hypothetical protein